jgi:hypothetical protein
MQANPLTFAQLLLLLLLLLALTDKQMLLLLLRSAELMLCKKMNLVACCLGAHIKSTSR